ncbi:thioredoxin domain-containing protein [Paenarthrobacter sp. DKR-5]|uniref:thioredoxin domain-containing protein n=1 Tax=Paenarthrobacter sp. DKR-5 TaxID=2835535 RepID=UPI001BDD5FEA|nr:thioredoxin domain-containing protein [Paenarthrobacter sp. DKR-5]MBT1002394.1 thioredoxin domain-containing protein [Paenarthrobacter sp. DKR-5]
MAPEPANALSGEPSAYLRQHRNNPVHWQPFGDAAFALAKARDVPVFLSIGYAACHWCHVMAAESFEDPETAAYLNARFVAVKVDREERPDVDAAYMAATQAISGEGGWPMSVFLTPEGRPFHAGTYFPPRPMPGRPSFRMVLEAVTEAWTERRDAVERSAADLARGLGARQVRLAVDHNAPPPVIGPDTLEAAVRSLASTEDTAFGGLGGAPKFPPSPVLEFLVRHAAGTAETAGEAAGLAGRTLAAMVRSALFDQLEGGFARYSVTRDWSVPHFEKMLYDNAQLLRVLAHWLRLEDAGDWLPPAEAAEAAGMTADWLLAGLRLPGGAFASSLDADTVTDGVHTEGGTYLWSPGELVSELGDDGEAVADLMNIRARGTVTETGSALHPGRARTAAEDELWRRARPRLRAARSARPQPERDEKVVAGWNGLAVAALADAGAVLGRPDLVAAAREAADYLWDVHVTPGNAGPGQLTRISHTGTARGVAGLLEDYAFTAEGFYALYAACGDESYYRRAEEIVQAARARFLRADGLADVESAAEQVANAQGSDHSLDVFDNATPSGAAVFAGVLLTRAAYSGSADDAGLALQLLAFVPALAAEAPRVAGWALAVAEAAAAGPLQLAVVGVPGPERDALAQVGRLSPSPGMVLAVGEPGQGTVPLLRDRFPAGPAAAYLCRGMVCRLPARSPAELAEQLAAGPA